MAQNLYEELRALPEGSKVLIRSPREGTLGRTERLTKMMAGSLGLEVILCLPEEGASQDTVFRRDYEMVEMADRVIAYFWEDKPMEGGTGHVVEAAINREKETAAWAVSRDNGHLSRVGDWP